MKILLPLFFLLFLLNMAVVGQCPRNIGFEDGSFNGWECSSGSVNAAGDLELTVTGPLSNSHDIIKSDNTFLDEYGGFPKSCPNGSKYSIKLGNNQTGRGAEKISYTYVVPAGQEYTLIFNYAVVLENPAHADYQQPKFTAKIFNVTDGIYIDCPSFNFVASADLPGFKLATINGQRGNSIYYKEWTSASINLIGYGGKELRIEFATNDCTQSGHFGYAYLDIEENCGSAITGNSYCIGQNSVTLLAPAGFFQYKWYNADKSKLLGEGQSLYISPAPPDQTGYSVDIIPYPGLGCTGTLHTNIVQVNKEFKLVVPDSIYLCKGEVLNLTEPSITSGSSSNMKLSYYTDSIGLTYAYKPDAITIPGIYYIKGSNEEGCQMILPVKVLSAQAALKVEQPGAVKYPATVDITKTFPHSNNYTYTYFADAQYTKPLSSPEAVGVSSICYIKALDEHGCEVNASVTIVVDPPPPYVVNGATTFTPNGDGINDYFSLNLKGFVSFRRLTIFTRSGQLVFSTQSQNQQWDGNLAGRNLPSGVYYWVFDGVDDYYKKDVHEGSYVAIVR